MVTVWIPEELIAIADQAAAAEDTDRSKFIRRAIREKIARESAPKPAA